jgi:hypothetical protein
VYQDYAYGEKATVMKFDGSNWVTVGSNGFSDSAAIYTSIAIDGSGIPYVVYQDIGDSGKATVMRYYGGNWVTVGSRGFSAGEAGGGNWIAVDSSGAPYVAYSDGGDSGKATVMKFDLGTWAAVGAAGFSVGPVNWISLAIAENNTPYVVFSDNRATVMKFDGSTWINVGDAEFSAGSALYPSIAVDKSGTPYVAYSDDPVGLKATVMKYGFPASVKNINDQTPYLSLYPNPNYADFKLNISTGTKASFQITITDMIGEKINEMTVATDQEVDIKLNVPTGIYILSAKSASGTLNAKIQVTK